MRSVALGFFTMGRVMPKTVFSKETIEKLEKLKKQIEKDP